MINKLSKDKKNHVKSIIGLSSDNIGIEKLWGTLFRSV